MIALCLQYPSHLLAVDTVPLLPRSRVDVQVPCIRNLTIYDAAPLTGG